MLGMTPEEQEQAERRIAEMARKAVEGVKALREVSNHPIYEEHLRSIMKYERHLGRLEAIDQSMAESGVDPDDLDLVLVEIDATVDRLERAAERERSGAWAAEPSEGEVSIAERRTAYQHGLASGLRLASVWLAAARERIADYETAEDVPDDANDPTDADTGEEQTP